MSCNLPRLSLAADTLFTAEGLPDIVSSMGEADLQRDDNKHFFFSTRELETSYDNLRTKIGEESFHNRKLEPTPFEVEML